MPDAVFYAKQATVMTLEPSATTTADLLGHFKSIEARFRNTIVEHNAVKDDWEYHTVIRTGCTLTAESFVAAGEAGLSANLSLIIPPIIQHFVVYTDFIEGGGGGGARSLYGTFSLEDGGWAGSDDMNNESITCRSHGAVTFA